MLLNSNGCVDACGSVGTGRRQDSGQLYCAGSDQGTHGCPANPRCTEEQSSRHEPECAELRHDGVKPTSRSLLPCLCCVTPCVQTRFSSPMWDSKEAADMSAERSFLNRIGEPHECGGIVRLHCVRLRTRASRVLSRLTVSPLSRIGRGTLAGGVLVFEGCDLHHWRDVHGYRRIRCAHVGVAPTSAQLSSIRPALCLKALTVSPHPDAAASVCTRRCA